MMEKEFKKIRCTASTGDCDCDFCFQRFDRLHGLVHLQGDEYLLVYEKETC